MKNATKKASLIVSIAILFLTLQVVGQSTKEQLKKIENYKENDSIKVELLIDYCVANTFSNTDRKLAFNQVYIIIRFHNPICPKLNKKTMKI